MMSPQYTGGELWEVTSPCYEEETEAEWTLNFAEKSIIRTAGFVLPFH